MSSGLSVDEKRTMVLTTVLPCLRNDLLRVCDAACAVHGKPGSGPNFASALLCTVACEALGRLTCDATFDDDKAATEFVRSLTDHCGDARYRDAAQPLIVFFRHGIAHSFLPTTSSPHTPGHPSSCSWWASWKTTSSGP